MKISVRKRKITRGLSDWQTGGLATNRITQSARKDITINTNADEIRGKTNMHV